jgi:glycosyltransferase involved in cell wall biosynthesis
MNTTALQGAALNRAPSPPAERRHRRRVLIAYKSMPHYRLAFFEALYGRLERDGVRLEIAYGDPTKRERAKNDTAALACGKRTRNRVVGLRGRELIWQSVLTDARAADLVVVEQASRLLANYVLLGWQRLGGPRVALWGHGSNLQHHLASRSGEAIKRRAARWPHWWFAYTEGVKRRVEELGFPSDRITVVQNSIDTSELTRLRAMLGTADRESVRSMYELGDGPVGVFVGGLYTEKRLAFLFDACDRIAAQEPRFRLLVVGDGPERAAVRGAVTARPYARHIGHTAGLAKVRLLSAADAMLMPGAVGLAVLDAFALALPLVTTALDFHGPEFEYVEHDENAIVVADAHSSAAYADAVVALLRDRSARARIEQGCRASASRYTNEAMVERFAAGVASALEVQVR